MACLRVAAQVFFILKGHFGRNLDTLPHLCLMARARRTYLSVSENCGKKRNHLTLVFFWIKKAAEIKTWEPTLHKPCESPISACSVSHVSPYSTRSKTQALEVLPCFQRRELPPREAKTRALILTADICQQVGKRSCTGRKRRRRTKKRGTEIEVRTRLMMTKGRIKNCLMD